MTWPLTPADLRTALDYESNQGEEEELALYAEAAMERVEEVVGRCRGQVTTSTLSGHRTSIVLSEVFGSVAVLQDGAPVTGVNFDLEAGILYGSFTGRVIQVTCTAPPKPPAVVIVSAKELAAIWYRQAHTGAIGRGRSSSAPWSPLGFAIPREISEKLEPFANKKLPGIG